MNPKSDPGRAGPQEAREKQEALFVEASSTDQEMGNGWTEVVCVKGDLCGWFNGIGLDCWNCRRTLSRECQGFLQGPPIVGVPGISLDLNFKPS